MDITRRNVVVYRLRKSLLYTLERKLRVYLFWSGRVQECIASVDSLTQPLSFYVLLTVRLVTSV
jgi:hypothetical protein